MKAQSAINPPSYENLGNRFRLNFNVQEKVDEDEEMFFEFETLEVPEIKKSAIVAGLIRRKYSIDDEIALINNHEIDKTTYSVDYQEYQDYRVECKTIANDYINE